jgi:glycerophosphoryl diester phosphodiesterase
MSHLNRPLILGHRGASAYAPENTLAAFNLAFELGADGIELDVALTQDNVPIVIHDDTLERTTNGSGKVNALDRAAIAQLDAGAWFDRKFSGERVPTLEQVLCHLKQGLINVEIKYTGVRLDNDRLEQAVADVILQTHSQARVLVSSFHPIALYRLARQYPQLQRGLLYRHDLPIYLRRAWFRPLVRPHALHPNAALITAKYVAWARAKGYRIMAWTVDDPAQARQLASWGVDAIITNKPDILTRSLPQSKLPAIR